MGVWEHLAAGGSFFEKRVGGFPEGDASSRWLIDIRTDLFPPTTAMVTATISMRLHEPRAIRWLNWRA
jgi:hypothetical protein